MQMLIKANVKFVKFLTVLKVYCHMYTVSLRHLKNIFLSHGGIALLVIMLF